jgi:hypothetical protein
MLALVRRAVHAKLLGGKGGLKRAFNAHLTKGGIAQHKVLSDGTNGVGAGTVVV